MTAAALRAPTIENDTVLEQQHLRLVEPISKRRRQSYRELRMREYLTPAEVEILRETARKRGRNGHRDATLILVAYRHGLRVSELCALTWDQIDFDAGDMHIRRVKNGKPAVHPIIDAMTASTISRIISLSVESIGSV